MAKYSTGSGGGSESDSCELCGADGVDLQTATVAGATLQLCSDCVTHGDDAQSRASSGGSEGRDGEGSESDRRRRAARNAARMRDAQQPDSSHWEDGADYDEDQLPYLVRDYGERVTEARQDAGLQPRELADEIAVDESDVLAVEQGRATKAGVGGSVIGSLEKYLDIQIAEET